MVVAAAHLKAGNPGNAAAAMKLCEGLLVDAKALALVKQIDREERRLYDLEMVAAAERYRKQEAREKARKKKEGVSIGMSQQDVIDSSWGRPEHVNTTTTARGTRQQWVYGSRGYLYFDDGVLTAIQN